MQCIRILSVITKADGAHLPTVLLRIGQLEHGVTLGDWQLLLRYYGLSNLGLLISLRLEYLKLLPIASHVLHHLLDLEFSLSHLVLLGI